MLNILTQIKGLFLEGQNKEIARNGFISLLSRSISFVASYLFFLYLTHSFSETAIGLFQLAQSILIILALVVSLGFQSSIVRFVSSMVQKKHFSECLMLIKKFLAIVVFLSTCVGLMVFFSANFWSNQVFEKPDLSIALKIVALALPIYALTQLLIELLRAFREFKYSELVKYVFQWIPALLICVITGLFWSNDFLPFIAFCSASGLSLFLILPKLKKHLLFLSSNAEGEGKLYPISYYLKRSYPMIFTSLSYIILIRIDSIMLGSASNVSIQEIGVYGIALKVAVIANFANVDLQRIAAPKISALFWDEKKMELKEYINRVKKINFFVTGGITLFLLIFARSILGIFGESYMEGLLVARIVTLAYFVNAFFGLSGVFMNMTGNEKKLMHIMLVTILINIVLNLILIRMYGTMGPAISTLFCFAFWNIITTIYISKKYKIKMYYLPFKRDHR
ncbi:MAG: flippase [Bacteroidota bacterium]